MPQRAYRHDRHCPPTAAPTVRPGWNFPGQADLLLPLPGSGQKPSGKYVSVVGGQRHLGHGAGPAGSAGSGLFLDQKSRPSPGHLKAG